MITTFLLNLIFSTLTFLVSLLPVGPGFPTDWTTAVYAIWGYINAFSFIVPVNVLVTALGIAMAFHLSVFAWHFLHWVYSLIRGSRVH